MTRILLSLITAMMLFGPVQAKERCLLPAVIWNDGSVTFDRPCFDAVLPARAKEIGLNKIDAKAAEWRPKAHNPRKVVWAYAIWASRRTEDGASRYLPGKDPCNGAGRYDFNRENYLAGRGEPCSSR